MSLRFFSILKNKYFIVLLAALVWLFFFESHSFMQQIRIAKDIMQFKEDKTFYKEEIEKDSLMIEKIKNDSDALERFARENYYMKKEGEDIFIIEEVSD